MMTMARHATVAVAMASSVAGGGRGGRGSGSIARVVLAEKAVFACTFPPPLLRRCYLCPRTLQLPPHLPATPDAVAAAKL